MFAMYELLLYKGNLEASWRMHEE